MPIVKKWSTGPLGNTYPDHSERSNPNTRGLSIDGVPGVEGYIEEDRVLANQDNRPVENLAQNDQVLEKNLASVASEVDYGVLRNKSDEFKIEVLQRGEYKNPEDETEVINITPLRIRSGEAIVNGQVVSTGSQKIIYFLKDDGSYIFPDYNEHEGKIIIPISDDLYSGEYKPVYDIITTGLPENFENYEIKITNKYDIADDRVTFFKVYRNWEDIVPFPPHTESTSATLNFVYDENYGRSSAGVWLNGSGVDNVKVSDVVVKKDIIVKDKLLANEKFIQNGNTYEQYIVTDGIFFDNIPWKTETQEKREVQDMYADAGGNIYFVYKHTEQNESMYYLPFGSTQVTNISLLNTTSQSIHKLVRIESLLYILGTNGFFATYNLVAKTGNIDKYNFFSSSSENFRDVELFQGKIWIATDKNIYNINKGDITKTATFSIVDFANDVAAISGVDTVDAINILKVVDGNFFVDSSLKTDVKNFITNPSFESGGVGSMPNGWSGNATISSSAKYGSYKVVIAPGEEIYQDVTLETGVHTLSAYVKSLADAQVELYINTLKSVVSVVGGQDWNRFSFAGDIDGATRIRIKNISIQPIQVDAVQLEKGDMNQFVEGFEYLLVGFKKNNDVHNPPYAIIDSKHLSEVNYSLGKYGFIKTINAAVKKGSNNVIFADNTDIYSMTFLNDEDEYNRITITNLTDNNQEYSLDGKIEQLKSIEIFDDRVFFGGSILNKAISFTLADTDADHTIKFIDPTDLSIKEYIDPNTYYYPISHLLGNPKIVEAHDGVGIRVEFPRVDPIYETRASFGEAGSYYPAGYYLFAMQIDDGDPIVFDIRMPAVYNGPVSAEEIYNLIVAKYPTQTAIKFNIEYSKSRVDGLYSIGKTKITRHIRGDIQRIFKQENIDSFDHYSRGIYVLMTDAILKSKYDTNIKKSDTGVYINKPDAIAVVENITQLPSSANVEDVYYVRDFGYYRWNGTTWVDTGYIYKWNLSNTAHSLREFKNKYNKALTFNDQSITKTWMPLPLTSGYKLVPGSLRVKTGSGLEVGFSEGEDYFVDYAGGRVIRSSLINCLKDSCFELVESSSNVWQSYLRTTAGSTFHLKKNIDSYRTYSGVENIVDSYASAYIESSGSNSGALYQYYTPKSLNVGDTYTFSVKLKTNKYKIGTIQISETTSKSAAFDTMNGFTSSAYKIGTDGDSFNEWHTYTVSHTVTSASSKNLRAEIRLEVDNIHEQLFIKEAQLERNQTMTPYVKEVNDSRIDAGMTVYLDFTESKELTNGVDYIFDTTNRKVVYHGELDDDTSIYFDYKYEKIFNPYVFATSIPRFDIKYDVRDDYFLFLYAGRVWAINFVLALLSQDEENPLMVTYDYHYPRIDKIKIRNSPDQFGNYVYIVKGTPDDVNPYGPYDKGTDKIVHTTEVSRDKIEDTTSSEMIYEINVFDLDFGNNDIYDRRVYVDSRDNRYYNISLYDQTVGYFPYTKDFMSTSGVSPLNRLYNSKIVDIIKNFDIKQLEEVGAWGVNYQLALRNKIEYPGTGVTTFVDIDYGNDSNTGELFTPVKTIKEALNRIKNGAPPNIIVKSQSLITEDVEVDLPVSEVRIFAQSYARWRGNIQNKTPLVLQGFQFEGHNVYVVDSIEFYYCTFINSTVNNYIPTSIYFANCRVKDGKNTFLYVKNTIFPSPFLHPYQRNASASDGVAGNPESVATVDSESVYPGVGSYQQIVTGNPSGRYKFFRCLVDEMSDDLVRYELTDNEPWISEFVFERSTIVKNKNLFYTNKSSQSVLYNECILWKNSDVRSGITKYFDSQSNINLQNCYTDLSITDDSTELNFNPNGLVFGRETCINGEESEPGFISTQEGYENYRLRSEAQGFLTNSVCIGRAADGRDLGCYDELRERLDVEVPKKLKSYFAYVGEGIHYPIVLNSEKITFILEFKPLSAFNTPAVLFDTRSSPTDTDFVAVVYNNNSGDKSVDIEPDPEAEISDPYTFKIIVANEKTRYAIVSPVKMYSDSDFQVWNKLSFTINYEKTFNEKAAFDEKDKYQNIITMFHNNELAVESFLKNDMSYDDHNNLLDGQNDDDTNDWNYNNLSRIITIGSTFDQQYILEGYYSELRIDNKFINRKELEAWNNKVVPFNDPITYLDQNNLTRTFDSSIVNELWTLKTKFDRGAKGHRFNEFTNKRFTYDNGELTWALVEPTNNLLENSDFTKSIFASATTDLPPSNDSEGMFPVVFNKKMLVKAFGGNSFDSSTGVYVDFTDSGKQFWSHDELYSFIKLELAKAQFAPSRIKILKLKDDRFRVITTDYLATSIEITFENGGDAEEFGFKTALGQGVDYVATNGASGAKIITGIKDSTSIVIPYGLSLDMTAEHNAWLEFGEEYTYFNETSLGISRIITDNNNDSRSNDTNVNKYIKVITNRKPSGQTLGLYDEDDDIPNEYTYSVYMYRKESTFSKDDVRVIVQESGTEVESNFDSIENIYGYWWLAKKTVRIISDANAKIGFIIKGALDIYVNAVQLERSSFASPYVVSANSDEGMLEIDKALLADDRGVIFFRFKPLFKYSSHEKKVLLEVLSESLNEETGLMEIDQAKGFKVWYEYDKKSNKGKIQFRTSTIEPEGSRPDESAWEVIALEQFWDGWHTIAISYDFATKRFTYFFDYFKNTLDSSASQFNFATSLSIGRSAIISVVDGVPQFTFGSKSANILVKDVLITNYTTSDNELRNWINAHEFYKETLFNNLLNDYQDEMYHAIADIEGLSQNSYKVEGDITLLKSRVSALEGVVSTDIDLTLLKVRQDELRNEVYHETNGILTKIDILDRERGEHDTRITQNRDNIIEHAVLIQENADNVAQEVSARIDADNNLLIRLASNTLGQGASLIGVNDPNSKFGATTVEFVLLELEGRLAAAEDDINAIEANITQVETTLDVMQDGNADTWTVTKAINNGWNIASLRTDVDANTSQITTLQSDLASEIVNRVAADTQVRADLTLYVDTSVGNLAGVGRTTETVKANWDAIQVINTNIASIQTNLTLTTAELNKVKDGSDGTTWDSTMSLTGHETRLGIIDTSITSINTALSTHTSQISTLETQTTNLGVNLTNEVAARTMADSKIVNDLASHSSGLGASLIGIQDAADSFTSSNVEGALLEIDAKLQALAGSLNWQASVMSSADLPTSGNNLNDSRIVQNDGDGKRAQYVWNGTGWVKVADVDWGDASGVVYTNTNSGLESTNVQAAIDELYVRSVAPNSTEHLISSAQWVSSGGLYYYDINHGLNTINIAVRATDENGQEIGVEEYERIDINTVRAVVSNPINATFMVFGAQNSYSKVVGNWTPSSGMYLKDIIHGFNTTKLMVSVFNIQNGERVGVENIETLDENAIRIMTDNNVNILNVFILKQTSNATTKDIDYWVPVDGMYQSVLPLALDYDAVYSFFDPATSKTVEVDSVKFSGGTMTIKRTQNSALRMVILK